MHLRDTVRELVNEDLQLFETCDLIGRKNDPSKISSTIRFVKFKNLEDNWGNASNKHLQMHVFLKSVFELTPKPLSTHSLITNDDIALQRANTLNSSLKLTLIALPNSTN